MNSCRPFGPRLFVRMLTPTSGRGYFIAALRRLTTVANALGTDSIIKTTMRGPAITHRDVGATDRRDEYLSEHWQSPHLR